MQEFEVPATYSVSDDANAADSVFRHAEHTPELVVFNVPDGSGGWRDVTAAQFAQTVVAVAKGLIASGVEVGDRVAILSSTRYEWVVLDFAVWALGGCTVAVYDSSSAEQAKWILSNSETVLTVVETSAHRAIIDEIAPELPELRETLQLEEGAIDELIERGLDLDDQVVEDRRAAITAASIATLIYTSGTTGRPKGALISHANLCAQSAAERAAMPQFLRRGARSLMFLPMAHVFARAVALSAFDAGVTVAHTSDMSTLIDQLARYRPDFIVAVPRVFEKVFNGARQKAYDGGRGKIFDRAAAVAVSYSRARETGGPSLPLRLQHAVFDRLVYSTLRAAMGGRCRAAVSGGGPLGVRLGHFFRGIGVTVYEGYGLTETTAALSVNTVADITVGSVGQPLPGHAARIAEDGELLVRGPVVFGGYWNNPEATASAFTDDWFATGDVGAIDERGFIAITGRKKELLVTAGGKNVAPAIMEDALRAHPLIGQALVVGDAKPFVGALVTLDPEALPGWKQRRGLPADLPTAKLIELPDVVAEVDAAVAETNKLVSHAEAIKKVRILPMDWTPETGELTPKLSIKRHLVMEKYASEVAAIYE